MTKNGNGIIETAAGALYSDVIDLDKIRKAHKPFAPETLVKEADGNGAAAYACLQMWRCILFVGFPITKQALFKDMAS